MKDTVKSLIVAALCLSASSVAMGATVDYDALYREHKSLYGAAPHAKGKLYGDASDDDAVRFPIFVANMRKAAVMSEANPLATFGHRSLFAAMTTDEFAAFYHSKENKKMLAERKPNLAAGADEEDAPNVADPGRKIDWRTKGGVTRVLSQGQCGSCWAFSTAGNIEGQWVGAGNTLVPVSIQELVSCDTTNEGCNGGMMDEAYKWLLSDRSGQIVTEAAMPYQSGGGTTPTCPDNLDSMPIGATITGYTELARNEATIANYVYSKGPVACAVDATSWQFYAGGIMTSCISNQVDHGALIVGFDDINVPPYWIVKNWWGPFWGEKGYIRVKKGGNQCLIANMAMSAQVSS